jgi:hypothetical protein
MGTRALTFVYEGDTPIINLYRQYDGYPSGHGLELAQFLEGFKVGNGLGAEAPARYANGMGCLAAQLVAHFKDGAGQFYLHSPEQKNCGQDFEYHVYTKDRVLHVAITNRGCNFFGLTTSEVNESIFDGPVDDFLQFCRAEALA